MEAHFQEARKQLAEGQRRVGLLERWHSGGRGGVVIEHEEEKAEADGVDWEEEQQVVRHKLEAVLRGLGAMRELNRREEAGAARMWAHRIRNMTDEAQQLQAALGRVVLRLDTRRETRADLGPTQGMRVEKLGQEHASLRRSTTLMGEATSSGTAVLESLGRQGDTIRRTRGNLTSILASLGVSHNVLRLIDRAQFLERWMVYGGMFCVLVLLLLVFYWKRW